ncbi:hypothetical protein [Lactococcus garvieae]|uniref:hypothetical protein n=1 Tax=Lactococcus garvieae TaxID=1363 RepID=UPI000308CF28|nr:hypothetical protein [Lactococcus garvieae]
MLKKEGRSVAQRITLTPQEARELSKEKLLTRSLAECQDSQEKHSLSHLAVIRYAIAPVPGDYSATLGGMTAEGEVETYEMKVRVRDRRSVFLFVLFLAFSLLGFFLQ